MTTQIYDLDIAIDMINGVNYKPGWSIMAKRHDNFEQGITVRFEYPAKNANRDLAQQGYPMDITANASFIILCNGCTEVELYRQIANKIMVIEEHEMREFLRVGAALDAPFHPHHIGGMKAWGDVQGDLTFGMA